jgi:adenylosuccinate synthase
MQIPAVLSEFARCKPMYKEFKGWQKDISKIRSFKALPKEAKSYILFIQRRLKVPIKIVSVGAERESNILL